MPRLPSRRRCVEVLDATRNHRGAASYTVAARALGITVAELRARVPDRRGQRGPVEVPADLVERARAAWTATPSVRAVARACGCSRDRALTILRAGGITPPATGRRKKRRWPKKSIDLCATGS